MTKSRSGKLAHFFALCSEGATVLDVGVSGQARDKPGQATNFFLANYPRDLSTYTGLGVEDLSALRSRYPSAKLVEYDGKDFPFADKEFDWVFSNAVIEHVGEDADQLHFVNEMLRVAKQVYFTTPNRYFPVETHTNRLFAHWSSERFDHWVAAHRPALVGHLRLLGAGDLTDLMERSNATEYRIFRNRFFGWPMTFSVVANG